MSDFTPSTSADVDVAYDRLLASLRARVEAATGPLFTTDAAPQEGLFDLFLCYLQPEIRQRHTCNACKRFVETYGGLVEITPDGKTVPLLWSSQEGAFHASVEVLRRRVVKAMVTGVFFSSARVWGQPTTGSWSHMAATPSAPLVFRAIGTKNAGQVSAEKREDFGTLCRGIAEFSLDNVQRAYTLLTSGQLYRSEACIGVAKWLLDLYERRCSAPTHDTRQNLTWLAVATAPAGFCHIKSTMIGSLLEDISSGLAVEPIARLFAEKMNPGQYQRAQVAPAVGAIVNAERIVADLGIAESLKRRYVRIEDIHSSLWQPALKVAQASSAVFGHIVAKDVVEKDVPLALPSQTITWEKFQRTVLPLAWGIEVKVPASTDRFAALVTAAVEDSPPILQWDRADARNPVSWYYAAGIDGEFKRRVEGAGGQFENVDIRATLLWNNRSDLDIHCVTPGGYHIFFGDKRAPCRGWLDVDMNVYGDTDEPVENIRWGKGYAPAGRYRFYVHNYRDRVFVPSDFQVQLQVGDESFHYNGRIGGTGSSVEVFTFDYAPGQRLARPPGGAVSAPNGVNSWNLTPGDWAEVTRIVPSPNLWGDAPSHHGEHVFFLLKGCRDSTEGRGRGFFTETLISSLREIRSTLEAYTATSVIEGDAEGACGIGMANGRPWGLTVRVTLAQSTAIYCIDRWD